MHKQITVNDTSITSSYQIVGGSRIARLPGSFQRYWDAGFLVNSSNTPFHIIKKMREDF
jgi:hypothetical protein